jgi:polysaccharide deacetylase family protein (PEP-CTERM system associated)
MQPGSLGPSQPHILTVVLEDYCHVEAVSGVVPADYWARFESRVEQNTLHTLDLLDEVRAKATFFVLGWIADRQPDIVAEVLRRGHEVASKGYIHRQIDQMTPASFREDLLRSRDAIGRAAGIAVQGYKVPRGRITEKDFWALDILAEEGFTYDASLRPMGLEFLHEPHRLSVHQYDNQGRTLWEVPLSTWRLGPLAVPISGGNYVRQFPGGFVRRAIAWWDRTQAAPLVFYFHIWELDPKQPRITAAPILQRVRQYRNLGTMEDKIRFYLGTYPFTSVAERLSLAPANAVAPGSAPAATKPILVEGRPPALTANPSLKTPITVVVPCYNEEATLGYLSNTLDAFAKNVGDTLAVSYVFVDDGSKDRTWERLDQLFGHRLDCRFVRHDHNRGVAAATLTGIRASATEVVGVIDCDSTYDPVHLRDMVPLLNPGVALVTASPYHPQGRVINQLPAWRLFLSKGLSTLYRFILHNKLHTYTSCFRVYQRRAVAGMTLRNEGFVGITEILTNLDASGEIVVECPATMEVRLLGTSKMKVVKTIMGHLRLIGEILADGMFPSSRFRSGSGKEHFRDSAGAAPGSRDHPPI